ncbi:hypothetical protein [Nonomuraea typhae]|uniref:hypothetical protein n=1 Tax=Nonomuraea typhae TaxID=2603600 RepID=UPI0012FA8C2B|nr:hypothetical protein [Nonomuraea typhae]
MSAPTWIEPLRSPALSSPRGEPRAATPSTLAKDARKIGDVSMSKQPEGITLADWAAKVGRSEKYVRNFWRPQRGFPAPIGRQPSPHTTGPDPERYDEAALDAWRARTLTQPAPYPMPAEADELRTLGAIARLLGVDGKTISQYREAIEARVHDREQRRSRTLYRVRAVIEALNEIRRGAGVAADPEHDRRRRSPGRPGRSRSKMEDQGPLTGR